MLGGGRGGGGASAQQRSGTSIYFTFATLPRKLWVLCAHLPVEDVSEHGLVVEPDVWVARDLPPAISLVPMRETEVAAAPSRGGATTDAEKVSQKVASTILIRLTRSPVALPPQRRPR